jgi:hypothetical protein
MDISLRDVIVSVLIFAAFYATPLGQDYIIRKQKLHLLGPELAALVAPFATGLFLYKGDWEMTITMAMVWAGLWLGYWTIWRRKSRGT